MSTEAIESVTVSNSTVPIDSENFTLTCEVVGPYDRIDWMKDAVVLNHHSNVTANETVSYHIENDTLSFTPVTLSDDGKYQCVAFNRAGPHASIPFMLLVNCECCGGTLENFLTGFKKIYKMMYR